MIVLKVTIVEGRSVAQRAALIRRLSVAAMRHFGRPLAEVRVLITEIPRANWGIGGVSMAEREGQREPS